jgi:hypothetical protein
MWFNMKAVELARFQNGGWRKIPIAQVCAFLSPIAWLQ